MTKLIPSAKIFASEQEAKDFADQYLVPGSDRCVHTEWDNIQTMLKAAGHTGNLEPVYGKATRMVNASNTPNGVVVQVPERVKVSLDSGDDLWINEKHLEFDKDGNITGLYGQPGVSIYVKPRPVTDKQGNPTGQWYASFEMYLSGSGKSNMEKLNSFAV